MGRRAGRLAAAAMGLLALPGLAAADMLRPKARPVPAVAEAPAAAPDEMPLPQPRPAALAPAEPVDAPPEDDGPTLGPETNLPLPRYVSLKSDESNVRRGPSLSHRIDWVFLRRGMPLQVTAEYGHWRRVVDREGLGGWVHYALLSGTRTVIVDDDLTPLRSLPDAESREVALLEAGVIARLGDCEPDWCRLSAEGYRGWAPKSALWGVDPEEIRE